MKKLNVILPEVSACAVTACAYNGDERCHAPAITVGDHVHPACDTYFRSSAHRTKNNDAGVGACKVSLCAHNEDFSCGASAIEVGIHNDHADCLTFEARA